MGFGKDGKGIIITERNSQSLGTLGDDIVIFIGTKVAIAEDFRILKSEVRATLHGHTQGEEVGLYLGLADGDLGVSEVGGALDANGPVDSNDIVQGNVAMRPVWLVGGINSIGGLNGNFLGADGGPIIKFNPRWSFGLTKSWNWFIWNASGSALTTGSTVQVSSKNFGVWA